MRDPRREPPAEPVVRDDDIPQEIARSLSSIWQRRTGVRPASITAEFSGDVVRCAIDAGEPESDPEPDGDEPTIVQGTDSSGYQHEACAAVTRIVRRKVSAYIASTDSKTGIATQKFIVERVRVRY
jgi:hypothetical protein